MKKWRKRTQKFSIFLIKIFLLLLKIFFFCLGDLHCFHSVPCSTVFTLVTGGVTSMENSRYETSIREESRVEAPRRDLSRRDASGREASRRAASRRETSKREVTNRDESRRMGRNQEQESFLDMLDITRRLPLKSPTGRRSIPLESTLESFDFDPPIASSPLALNFQSIGRFNFNFLRIF